MGDVRRSVTFAVAAGMSENRMRVLPAGSQSRRSRLTNFVANDALAVGVIRNRSQTSRTFSLISASTEQSPFSPMS